ncbi:septation protein IspZ [Bradyrhizobium sp. 157]|uniref:inner membrane-spanning protein YciB n=1 Tax=Bradyrhizobium sp. 157 TaxID=2782631 RepID=UPI001FF9D55F|nr:septation protein IspZ [Bradyrhizobium sp. 157]MCK1641963.1 septation protein IspZ [Bradyrhizobium sp. 157]
MQVVLKHLLLDFLSTFAFFVIVLLTNDVMLALCFGIGFCFLQIAVQRYLRSPIPPIQLMALALVLVFGASAFITSDSRFLMAKPSISRAAIGIIMLRRGWLVRYLPKIARDALPAALVERVGYVWAALMFGLAALNLLVATTASIRIWALYSLMVPTTTKAVALIITYLVFRNKVNRVLAPVRSDKLAR